MALYRKWISVRAVLTIASFSGPIVAFSGSNSPHRPPTPPRVPEMCGNAQDNAPAPSNQRDKRQ